MCVLCPPTHGGLRSCLHPPSPVKLASLRLGSVSARPGYPKGDVSTSQAIPHFRLSSDLYSILKTGLPEQVPLIQPPSSSIHQGSPVPWSEGPAPTVEVSAVFYLSGRDISSQRPSSLRKMASCNSSLHTEAFCHARLHSPHICDSSDHRKSRLQTM